MTDASETRAAPQPGQAPPTPAPTRGDKILLVVFWAWAVVLLVATLAQLFGWQGVLDALDVKRWFAR